MDFAAVLPVHCAADCISTPFVCFLLQKHTASCISIVIFRALCLEARVVDSVVVGVGVLMVGDAVAVRVAGALLYVGEAVVVVVGVEVVGRAVAVEIAAALHAVGDAVAVAVRFARIGNAVVVAVRIAGALTEVRPAGCNGSDHGELVASLLVLVHEAEVEERLVPE